jgi:hypothetical protein
MPQILIDWKNPDYAPVFKERQRRLISLRANPSQVPKLQRYYKTHIVHKRLGYDRGPPSVGFRPFANHALFAFPETT